MKEIDNYTDWQRSNTQVFWGEIAPCDHVVQIYEDDGVFLDMLAGFVGGGIKGGDCTVIIATQEHLKALDMRLRAFGLNVDSLVRNDQYIPLNAEESLSKFMIDGWPNESLFSDFVTGLIERAGIGNRKVRAFGEMVAVLWAQGLNGATVQLEHLWNHFCDKEAFCLFCAYPKSGFTQDINQSMINICGKHSMMIEASDKPLSDLFYRSIDQKLAG